MPGIARGDNVVNFTDKDRAESMAINLVSPLKLIIGLQDSVERAGSIVNVTSCYGALWGMDMSHSYSATKAALSNATKSLAVQLREHKIRANAVRRV